MKTLKHWLELNSQFECVQSCTFFFFKCKKKKVSRLYSDNINSKLWGAGIIKKKKTLRCLHTKKATMAKLPGTCFTVAVLQQVGQVASLLQCQHSVTDIGPALLCESPKCWTSGRLGLWKFPTDSRGLSTPDTVQPALSWRTELRTEAHLGRSKAKKKKRSSL